MNIFRNRPLALGSAVLIILLPMLYGAPKRNVFILLSILTAAAVTLIAVNAFTHSRFISLASFLTPSLIAVLMACIIFFAAFSKDEKRTDDHDGTSGRYTLLIESVERESGYVSVYVARAEELDIRVLLIDYSTVLDVGNRISADVEIRRITDAELGDGAFLSYLSKRIFLIADCTDYSIEENNVKTPRILFNSFNKALSDRLNKFTDRKTASVLSALFLGNRGGLDRDISRDFARLGISHILALSGMHLSVIASFISGIFIFGGIGKRKRIILTLVSIWTFMAITGFPLSALRAGLMLTVFYLSFFLRKRADFITRIFLAVALICIIWPYSVFSVSLILSFLAMLGCVICSRLFSKVNRTFVGKKITGVILTTLVINLLTLPIMFLYFDFLSLVSPFANIIFIPIFSFLIYLAPLLIALGGIPFIGDGISWACESVTEISLNLAQSISGMRGIVLPFNSKIHAYAVVVIFASAVLFMVLGKRKAYMPAVSLFLGAILFTLGSAEAFVKISNESLICPNGTDDGDDILAFSNGEIAVIDCYSPSKSRAYEISSAVRSNKYSEIELYVAVDYGYRTVEALDTLTDLMIVRNVALPVPCNEDEEEICRDVKSRLSEKNVNLLYTDSDIEFGDLNIRFSKNEHLERSEKRLVCFSITGETSRFTYVGASVYDGIASYEFAKNHIYASDAVYFGIYGPKYKVRYRFDMSNVEYCVFSPASAYYSACDTAGVRTVLQGRKIIME